MDRFFGTLRRTISDVGSVFREAAHDAVYDFRDNALGGFGLPRLVTSAASFSVAGLAAVGTFAITSELVSKVHSSRYCKTCCGWGSLQCRLCLGTGHVQYSISKLSKSKPAAVEKLVNDLLDGKEEIIHHPAGYNPGYPLPYKKCPECTGKGISTCHDCGGLTFAPQISFDNAMNVPWKTWDVQRKSCLSSEADVIYETVKDPAVAAFFLYERDEIESGIKYDDEVKEKLMSKYYRYRDYDEIREEVAMRKPGWEKLQQALYSIDAERAKRDPIIIQDVPYYKALKAVEAEVASLEVPARPVEWTEINKPFLEKMYGDNAEEKNIESEEIRTLVEARDDLIEQVLNAAWTKEWRDAKIEEMVQQKIDPYLKKIEKERVAEIEKSGLASPTASPGSSTVSPGPSLQQSDMKAAAKKAAKSQKADKKKERQERLAKQAAEREAALRKAKDT